MIGVEVRMSHEVRASDKPFRDDLSGARSQIAGWNTKCCVYDERGSENEVESWR